MKKVDIKKYYFGLDNFYALQILKDTVKNLYIVWTRWGRSGTRGQFQRTPFGLLEDAKKEFCKIFKQKSGWAWKEVEHYSKLPKKYELKRVGGKLLSKSDSRLKFSQRDFDYEDLVKPFDELDIKVPRKWDEGLEKFLEPLICDTQIFQSIKDSNLMNSLMLCSPQDKDTVDKGLEILKKI